jgi:hypothetical protein
MSPLIKYVVPSPLKNKSWGKIKQERVKLISAFRGESFSCQPRRVNTFCEKPESKSLSEDSLSGGGRGDRLEVASKVHHFLLNLINQILSSVNFVARIVCLEGV